MYLCTYTWSLFWIKNKVNAQKPALLLNNYWEHFLEMSDVSGTFSSTFISLAPSGPTHCTSTPRPWSFLADLFDDTPLQMHDDMTLHGKLDKILENQNCLFSLLTQLLGGGSSNQPNSQIVNVKGLSQCGEWKSCGTFHPWQSVIILLSSVQGHGIECASIGEVLHGIDVGFSPENIVFDSPVKTLPELSKYALQCIYMYSTRCVG